jgi:hypothetical protein
MKKALADSDIVPKCQLQNLPSVAQPIRPAGLVLQLVHRVQRVVKRRRTYLRNLASELARPSPAEAPPPGLHDRFRAGDPVRVRSAEAIRSTLDRWNQLRGCAFMEEMWPYCGTSHRVLKRVERFMDERDYLIKRCSGIVLLEDARCEGTKDFGPCDRYCYYFWREEWLERVPAPAEKAAPPGSDVTR